MGGQLDSELTECAVTPFATINGTGSRIFCRDVRSRRRNGQGQSAVCRSSSLSLSRRHALAGPAGTFWRPDQDSHPIFALGEERRMEEDVRGAGRGRGEWIRHDRQHYRTRASAQCRRSKKDGEDQAIGRSKGGLSTKIHAMVDALGNPLAFLLTAGQAHDLEGADAMLPQMQADALLADKAFDADLRLIEPLLAAGKTPVIPPKSNRAIERSNAPTTRNCTKRATSWKISIESSNSTEP